MAILTNSLVYYKIIPATLLLTQASSKLPNYQFQKSENVLELDGWRTVWLAGQGQKTLNDQASI